MPSCFPNWIPTGTRISHKCTQSMTLAGYTSHHHTRHPHPPHHPHPTTTTTTPPANQDSGVTVQVWMFGIELASWRFLVSTTVFALVQLMDSVVSQSALNKTDLMLVYCMFSSFQKPSITSHNSAVVAWGPLFYYFYKLSQWTLWWGIHVFGNSWLDH